MTLEDFLSQHKVEGFHIVTNPDAKAAAFNAGYSNIWEQDYADNPHPQGSIEREWFQAGEQMAIDHLEEMDGSL